MTKSDCFLGIDVGKFEHQASLIDEKGNLIGQSMRFENNLSSFQEFVSEIKKRLPLSTIPEVGLESTGHYWFNLKNFLNQAGFKSIDVLNPITTREKAKQRIRKVKNDRIDSLIIAQIIREKAKTNRQTKSFAWSVELRELRNLTRFNAKLKSQEKFIKREMVNLFELIWPEFEGFFSQLFLATPRLIMVNLKKLGKIKEEDFIVLLKKSSRSRLKEQKIKEILVSFRSSIGSAMRDQSAYLRTEMLLANLNLLQGQISQIKKRINQLANFNFPEFKELTVIKGLSDHLAAVCLAEIGSIERFSSADKLTAFAGLDPSVFQSGNYCRKNGNHISKRGSPYLRQALYYAAKTAIIFEPTFRTYYQEKKRQGKHYNLIVIAVARKILGQIYHILKKQKRGNPESLPPNFIPNFIPKSILTVS